MEILKIFWISIVSFFGISTQSISTTEIQTSIIEEIQKPQPTIEPHIISEKSEKETDTKELIEETKSPEPTKEDLLKEKIRHKNENNIAFIKARKEQEKPKKKRQPPVKLERQLSNDERKERWLRESAINEQRDSEKERIEDRLEDIEFEEMIERKYQTSPQRELDIPEFGINLIYPEMDFTKIIENPKDHQKKHLKKSNVEFYSCEDSYQRFPCEKGVRINCYVGAYGLPSGLNINITKATLPEYITSQIQKRSSYIFKPPPFLEKSKKLQIESQEYIHIDEIPADKFKLSNHGGYNRFIPGKNHNYIIKTESDEGLCVQDIIESIKFLDK